MALELCLATGVERHRRFPGDELIPQAVGTVTHAITIDAPPEHVWPWLVQMGAGRAGWYSFDRIDNGGKPSSGRILPEFQHIAAGDLMPSVPGATDAFVVKQVISGKALVLVVPVAPAGETRAARLACSEGPLRASWALILEEVGHRRTRLIGRGNVSANWLAASRDVSKPRGSPIFIERVYGLLAKMPRSLMLPAAAFGHYVFQSRQLRGIKQRAEQKI